jgi:predicted ester cyclase
VQIPVDTVSLEQVCGAAGEVANVADVVDDIMALWQRLPEDPAEARAAVSRLYAERCEVNGVMLTVDDLLARARALQAALSDLRHELLERVEAGDQLSVAFTLHGRHTGPLQTSIGVVPATGKTVSIQGMDILTFSAGRITKITVLSDEIGLLSRLDAVTLR